MIDNEMMALLREANTEKGLIRIARSASDSRKRTLAKALLVYVQDGGEGSGNHHHAGRPGHVGGSASGGGESSGSPKGLGAECTGVNGMKPFHDALKKSAPDAFGDDEHIDAFVRRMYMLESTGRFDYETGKPFEWITPCPIDEYMTMPYVDRLNHCVDYEDYKAFVLENNPEFCAAPGSIVDTFLRYNTGANPSGYGRGKGARLRFDQETGLSKFIDEHPELHYNGDTLYRGIETNKAGVDELEKALKSGKPITMRGPSSWSTKESVADDFTKYSLRATRRGTRVIFRDSGKKARDAIPFPYSSKGIMPQYEVLYSGSASFRVTNIEEKGGVMYVDVEPE